MAEIIDIQMPPDQVVNSIKQMQSAIAGLEAKLSGLGSRVNLHDPFLKGERAVSRATGSMVTNLVSATSVSDALATSLASVERGGRLGLGLAVGVAAGVAAFEALSKAIQHSHEVHDAADKALSRPLNLQTGLDAAGIGSEINATAAALAAEQKQNTSYSEALLNTYLPSRMANPFVGLGGQGGVDTNFDREIALNERLNALSQARGEAELRIAQFKKDSIDGDEHAVAYAKAELDFKNKTAALKLETAGNPEKAAGFEESFKALQIQRDVEKQIADKKQEKEDKGDLVKQEEDSSASDIANFQGTKDEKEDFAVTRSEEKLQNEIDILHAYGDQEAEKKKQLELDELISKASDKKADKEKRAADEAEKAAKEKAKDDEKKSDEDFKSHQELSKAKGDNKVTALELQGLNFQANILKTRQATEAKIAQLLRDQKGELAGQAAIAGKLDIVKALGARLSETPAETAAREAKEQKDRQATALAEAQLRDAANREAHGARLDENNAVTQALRAQQDIDKQLGQDKGKGDFTSVASLAGLKFEGLASLGDAKFEGLAALAALQLKVI